MIGLLALGAPKTEAPAPEPVPEVVTQPVDTYVVEPVSNDSAALLEQVGHAS